VAPQWQWQVVLTQHVQASGVVNLRIHQKNCFYSGVAQAAGGLQGWKATNLLKNVG
jgi:hypothetical protein